MPILFVPDRKTENGFSLVELLIVSVMLLIILGIMTTIVSGVQSSYNEKRESTARLSDATAAIDLISRVLRNAGNNTTATSLIPTGNNRVIVKGDWNPSDNDLNDPFENVEFMFSQKTLFLIDHSTSTPVVSAISEDVSALTFEYYNANGNMTTDMSQVVKIKVTLSIGVSNPQTLNSVIAIRNKVQPK